MVAGRACNSTLIADGSFDNFGFSASRVFCYCCFCCCCFFFFFLFFFGFVLLLLLLLFLVAFETVPRRAGIFSSRTLSWVALLLPRPLAFSDPEVAAPCSRQLRKPKLASITPPLQAPLACIMRHVSSCCLPSQEVRHRLSLIHI